MGVIECILVQFIMFKGAVLLALIGVAQAGFPVCSTVWEDKCWDEPRQKCDYVQKPFTTTVYEEECNTIQVPKVDSVPEQKCEDVPEQKCETKYEQECHTTIDNERRTEYSQECDYASKPVQKYKE